ADAVSDNKSAKEIEPLIERMGSLFDELKTVRDDLITLAYDQLLKLASTILHKSWPRLEHLHSTHSVLHEALIRFETTLRSCRPASAEDFFGLAGHQIRLTLLTLAEKADRRKEIPLSAV